MKEGNVWKYGDNINTDIISPPQYMELQIEEAKKYTMATVDPSFASGYEKGDYFVAEHNLGSGSSRETAPLMLKALGVKFLIAMDYARIFYRNCINVGLLPIECAETDKIKPGHTIDLDYRNGKILNKTSGETYECSRIPPHITEIADCGGLIGYIKAKKK
ncbi:MAG: 3-isopropylmalate dehydratase [Spirochaetia bacterium]|jgi:3-isopropylmalate/(R)-2-methylmalate dehydratase small subunit|nr:3-isopropylmalate dehydratase [Spirochaetia bacterium]